MKMLGSLLLAAVVAVSAEAQHLNCGSSVEVTERQRELGIWAEGRARVMAAKGFPAATASLTNNVYVLPADETTRRFCGRSTSWDGLCSSREPARMVFVSGTLRCCG